MRLPPYAMFPNIQGDKISLREIIPEDIPDLIEISYYDAVQAKTFQEATEMHMKITRDYHAGNLIHWGIADKVTLKILGTCGYYRGFDKGAGELGFVLLTPYRGQGFMTAALLLAIDFGINEIGLNRIWAVTHKQNEQAIALFERLGFAQVAVLEEDQIEYELSPLVYKHTLTKSQILHRNESIPKQMTPKKVFTERIIREATVDDIPQIQVVRNSVTENTLSDPNLVSDKDCEEFLTKRGKGWVCEIGHKIVGFSIADLQENNIWALFIKPEFEKQGIGKILHDTMLDWYFEQTRKTVWLGTTPGTRADMFYRKTGWKEIGTHGKDEIKFEMTFTDWTVQQKKNK